MTVKNFYENDDSYDHLGDDFSFPTISDREMACERLLFNTTEDILLAMQDSNVSQSDLAKKLGKSKAHISQLLDGTRNMTLKTLSDICYALDAVAKVVVLKDGKDVSHQIVPERKSYNFVTNDIADTSTRGSLNTMFVVGFHVNSVVIKNEIRKP